MATRTSRPPAFDGGGDNPPGSSRSSSPSRSGIALRPARATRCRDRDAARWRSGGKAPEAADRRALQVFWPKGGSVRGD